MLGNLTALAIASFISIGSYAYSIVAPKPPHLISPLPVHSTHIIPTHTPTPTPTPHITITSTPIELTQSSPTPQITITPTQSRQIPTPTTPLTPIPTDTPIPIPTTPPVAIITTNDLDTLFQRYAGEFSVDKELLKKIARCESGFNSNAGNGDYLGMFQFAASSWIAVRQQMGADTNPDLRKNAEEAIRTAAFKIAHGGSGAWPSCSK